MKSIYTVILPIQVMIMYSLIICHINLRAHTHIELYKLDQLMHDGCSLSFLDCI